MPGAQSQLWSHGPTSQGEACGSVSRTRATLGWRGMEKTLCLKSLHGWPIGRPAVHITAAPSWSCGVPTASNIHPGLLTTHQPPGAHWEQGQGRCWGGGRGLGSRVDSTGGGKGVGAWRREAQPRLQCLRGGDGTVQGTEGDPISLIANTFLAGLEPSVRGGEEQGPRARLSHLYPSSLGLGHR